MCPDIAVAGGLSTLKIENGASPGFDDAPHSGHREVPSSRSSSGGTGGTTTNKTVDHALEC
jgi:hypothetical protein